jgi:hypothetical protein
MKNLKINYLKHSILLALICFLSVNCQRDMSDDATLSTYSKNGEVFIDGFSAGLGYGAFGGSKYTAFTVDKEVKYDKGISNSLSQFIDEAWAEIEGYYLLIKEFFAQTTNINYDTNWDTFSKMMMRRLLGINPLFLWGRRRRAH